MRNKLLTELTSELSHWFKCSLVYITGMLKPRASQVQLFHLGKKGFKQRMAKLGIYSNVPVFVTFEQLWLNDAAFT